jgi:hypothetical protein
MLEHKRNAIAPMLFLIAAFMVSCGHAPRLGAIGDSMFATPENAILNEVSYIDSTVAGSGYSNTFTCSPPNGNRLNIYLKNNGSSSVVMTIVQDGYSHASTTVNAGADKTNTYYMADGSGIGGGWTIGLTSPIGDSLDVHLIARQSSNIENES